MPGADASQFIQFRKANAVQNGDTQRGDPKSVNRLTQYVPQLSAASSIPKFLPSLTLKNTRVLLQAPINVDTFAKKNSPHQNCA
jgi:hypothetical protein